MAVIDVAGFIADLKDHAADHGFHVLRSSGRSDEDVLGEIGEASGVWVSGLRTG